MQVLGILNEYPHVAVPGGVQVALGDAYAGEKRRIVFELHVPTSRRSARRRSPRSCCATSRSGDQVEQHELTIPLVVNLVSADEAAASAPDLEVREEVLVLKAARARDEAIRLADAGRFEEGQQVLHSTVMNLRDAGLSDQADLLAPEIAALERYDPSVTQAAPLPVAATAPRKADLTFTLVEDVLDLPRVGITPDAALMSTYAGRMAGS